MKLNKLKEIVDTYVNHGYGDRDVVIDLDEPSIGCGASTSIKDIYPGIDWESFQIRIQTKDKICRLGKSKDDPMKMRVFAHITSRKHYECPVCDKNYVDSDYQVCPVDGTLLSYIERSNQNE